MSANQTTIIPIAIEDEIKESYLTYAMSVIVSRALPDVRDGLKPVHRRILFCMNEMGLSNNKSYKKCARIVGDVLGKYHPHGDQAVYDALVRMAQDFSLRIPVVQGQGNFGSVDGDPPAAMRYTEAKLSKVSEALLRDIKKETVNFVPNYDDSMIEPSVLPTAFPFLLVNGSNGIAVGMATNMAPHNLKEVSNAIVAYVENPEITIDELINFVPAPDFPTGATICGLSGYRMAAHTGRGKITVRSDYHIENEGSDKEKIIITAIPYQVNKANLVIKIAELVKEKRVEGISDLRDESDRKGMRIVIELKRNVSSRVIMNQLYSYTSLQNNFNINNLALVNGRPQTCNLKQLIQHFVSHREEIITRRTKFDLKKAQERAHILEALKIALDNIDEVIKLIRGSKNGELAKAGLIERFSFTSIQAQAILDMRLQRLTSLESQKIIDELNEILALIKYLEELLANRSMILNVIREETMEVSEKYGSARYSEISHEEVDSVSYEDLIEKEMMVVVVSNQGFVKRMSLNLYREQRRGGKGSRAAILRDEDFIEHIFVGTTHDMIMLVSSLGKAYWVKVYELPEGGRDAKGRHLKTLFEFEDNEEVTAIIPLDEFREDSYIFMVTRKGVVKRVTTHSFRNAKRRGIIALNIDKGDTLMRAILTKGNSDIMLFASSGKGLRFNEDSIRIMGRNAYGVRGLRLKEDDTIVGIALVDSEETILLISEKGYGKRTAFSEFVPHARGTQGQRAFKVSEKTGNLVSAIGVHENDSILCITSMGKTIKTSVSNISLQGRNAIGVKTLSLNEKDGVIGLGRVQNEDQFDENEEVEEEKTPEPLSADQINKPSIDVVNEEDREDSLF